MDEAKGVWMGEDTRGVQALARKTAMPTLPGGVYVSTEGFPLPLYGGDAFVLEVHFPCECHHAGKHALAQAAAKKLIPLFAAYERPGVKDECFGVESNFIYGAIHVGQLLANVDGLIVEHHSYDIETGVVVRIEETAGLVDEYTQFLLIAFHAPHKRKRRKSLPATSTGTFPRVQVLVFKKSEKFRNYTFYIFNSQFFTMRPSPTTAEPQDTAVWAAPAQTKHASSSNGLTGISRGGDIPGDIPGAFVLSRHARDLV